VKGITGRPTAGARLSVTRVEEGGPEAAIYRGFVHLPDADIPAEARIDLAGGPVKLTLGDGGTPELEKTATALLRAATKSLVAKGGALPWKIVRWRD
jgi:hypothetical protein